MLAYFSLWGAFFSVFAVSWALLALFLLMLVVFFRLRVAPDWILDCLAQVLERSKPYLAMLFGVSKHTSQKRSSCNKAAVFAMFYKLPNASRTATKRVFCIAFTALLDMMQ